MVGIRFGGGRDELLTFMQYLGVITPPYLGELLQIRVPPGAWPLCPGGKEKGAHQKEEGES